MARRSRVRALPAAGRLALAGAVVALALAAPALAGHAPPIDHCVGVDHPPFAMAYEGDGLSYLLFGATTPLDAYPPGALVHGVLDGNGRSVEAEEPVDESGRSFLTFPLTSYGDYTLTVDVDGHPLLTEPVTVGPAEPPCARDQLAQAPPPAEAEATPEPEPEPTAAQTPETPAPESPVVADPTATAVAGEPAAAAGDFPWGILVGGGLALGLAGLLVARGGGPCEEQRRAWERAKAEEQRAAEEAERAREAAEDATEEREVLDEELEEIRREFPDAGKPGGDDAWVEVDGRRINLRDVRMRRAAARAAWDRYRQNPNPETAKELAEEWEETDTPEAAEERREVDERAKDLQRRRDEAADAERAARERAERADEAHRRARDAADAAHAAYQDCLGKAAAPAVDDDETATSGGGAAVAGTGGGGGSTQERGCSEGEEKEENVTVLGTVRLPVALEVGLSGGDAQLAAEEGRDIAGTLADVSQKLGWLSLALDLKRVGGSLVLDRDGWKALGQSVAPATGAVTGTPTPSTPLQAAVDYLRTVAGIASVIIRKVPELQARQSRDCQVSATTTFRWLRMTCADVLRCDGGRWVPQGKRFTVTLEREGSGGQHRQSALTWAEAQAEIAEYEEHFTRRLIRALDKLEQARQRCGAGS